MSFIRIILAVSIAAIMGIAATTSASARSIVSYKNIRAGEIIVRTGQRRLYFGLGNGKAIRYPVGVGRRGKQWSGKTSVRYKVKKPAWAPTAQIRRDNPNLPKSIPGGSSRNPLGAAALVLAKGNYAIHGTNRPSSIGGFVSYGCIRMHNRDIRDLYKRVGWFTPVTVTR